MALNSVKILYKGGTAEIEVKKSRFIANLKPVESEEEAAAFIAEIKKKYWDARHNCQAFTIGMNHELTRCSDDGEPAQTAGRPMLDVLLGEDVEIFRRDPAWNRRSCAGLFRRCEGGTCGFRDR